MNISNNSKIAKYRDFAGLAIILTLALVGPVFGGWDFKVAYRGDTLAGTYGHYTVSPYPLYWFIYPFAILPEDLGYVLWNLANAFCFILAVRHWKGNLFAFSVFIGVFWTFFGGQIEGFVCGALVLALLPNPWLAGLGIMFLSLKPQVGILPILFVLLNRKDWKLLVVPAVVYLASFIHWGWWIPKWLDSLHYVGNVGTSLGSNVSLYPYGLIFLLILWRYRSSLKIWMFVQSLIMPYSPIYSLAPALSLEPPPLWASAVIWIFYLSLETHFSLVVWGFVFPLTFLAIEIWRTEKQYRQSLKHEEEHAPSADAAVHDRQ